MPPTGGCKTNEDCPDGNTCINGQCKPKSACNIQAPPDRLQGAWQYDSMLHFREALNPVLGGVLTVAEAVRDIIQGRFEISGIPSFITSFVEKYLKKLIDEYVPPWGQELVVALGDINDIVDDMRVLSTVQTTAVGNNAYVNNEQWDLVEFTFRGKKLSTPPQGVPQIGQVKIPPYSSYEVCGVLIIAKHDVNNVVGGLILWAINTGLSIATCSSSAPCFASIDEALMQLVDCPALGMQIDQMVQSIWSGAPSVAGPVTMACESNKQDVIQGLTTALSALPTKLSLLELSGTVNIPNPPGDNVLNNGEWFGVLGSGVAKGNFDGEFSAKKK
jgi:hypothetical protein